MRHMRLVSGVACMTTISILNGEKLRSYCEASLNMCIKYMYSFGCVCEGWELGYGGWWLCGVHVKHHKWKFPILSFVYVVTKHCSSTKFCFGFHYYCHHRRSSVAHSRFLSIFFTSHRLICIRLRYHL